MLIRKNKGFSLTELMIAVAVIGILATVALPSMRTFLADIQIRTATEALQNGIQLARVEAVRRNANVRFVLGVATGWSVGCETVIADANGDGIDDCPSAIQNRSANEGSAKTILTAFPAGASVITFNGLGRVISNTPASPSITRLDIDASNISSTDSRDLRIIIEGGSVRVCDPGVTKAGDTRVC